MSLSKSTTKFANHEPASESCLRTTTLDSKVQYVIVLKRDRREDPNTCSKPIIRIIKVIISLSRRMGHAVGMNIPFVSFACALPILSLFLMCLSSICCHTVIHPNYMWGMGGREDTSSKVGDDLIRHEMNHVQSAVRGFPDLQPRSQSCTTGRSSKKSSSKDRVCTTRKVCTVRIIYTVRMYVD